MLYCVVELHQHAIFLHDVVTQVFGPFASHLHAVDCKNRMIEAQKQGEAPKGYTWQIRNLYTWE